jgi:hypothetical protein
MAPILGIYASQISGHLFAPSGAYDSIATTTVGAGGVSSVTFSSIPQTYTHLQVRYIARGTDTSNNIYFTLNSDTSGNYSDHLLYGDGSSVATANGVNTSTPQYISIANSSRLASTFAAGVFDLLDYANTNKFKTTRTLSGREDNSAGIVLFASANWRNTNAVTSLTFTPTNGSFAQYSSFALYGIKGN